MSVVNRVLVEDGGVDRAGAVVAWGERCSALAYVGAAALGAIVVSRSAPRSVTTDGAGGFRLPLVVRSGEAPGTYRLTVPGQPGGFGDVTAALLVVLGTYQPQAATGPAFRTSSILSQG